MALDASDYHVPMKWWKRLLEPIQLYLHRRALRAWMEELNQKYGYPDEKARAWAREVMEEANRKPSDETDAK